MKKVLFLMAAVMLMLSGCEQKVDVPVKANNKTITISLAQTKATISDNDEGAASFAWEEGDEIGVQVGNELVKFTLSEFEGSTAKFSAPDGFTGELEEGAFVGYPYVPEDCNNGSFAISYPSEYEVDKADAFRLRWSGTLKDNSDGSYNTNLEHTSAILRVTYTSVPNVASAVTMKVDDESPVTVKFSQTKTENMSFYFPVLEGSYDQIRVALAFENGGALTEIDGTAQTLRNGSSKLALETGKIYRTPAITLNLYELMTDDSYIENGSYVLAYYDAAEGAYKLFSFEKTMENAEAAAAAVQNVHGLSNLFAKGSQIYSTVIGKNYVSVAGNEGALAINVPAAVEESTVLNVSGNSSSASTTLSSNGYSLRLDDIITSIASDGAATLSVQPNAPDAIAIMNDLRGGTVSITFGELVNFAIEQAKKEGVTFTDAQVARLRSGFEHLCSLAKELLASHNMGNLMDIDLDTDIFTVIAQYYDNAATYSQQIAPDKMFGWATPVGFHKYDDGFTANVSVPSKGWFDRLQASLQGDKDACVAYWAQFDSQYDIAGIENFFSRLARRAVNELDDSTYEMLQQINFTAIGNVYGNYVDRFNDSLEPVYLYKKLQ